MVFLTITIISIVAIQRSLVSHKREQLFIETRINSMNNMYESTVRDLEKSLEIIAHEVGAVAKSLKGIDSERNFKRFTYDSNGECNIPSLG